MNFIAQSKDRLVESLALPLLNKSIFKPYGKATSLRVNSTTKTAQVVFELKGENKPVQIEVNRYELLREGERFFVLIEKVHTSREWLTVLAERFLLNRKLEMPPKAAVFLFRCL